MASEFLAKTRKLIKDMEMIQRRMKAKLETQDAKFEVIKIHWNLSLFAWMRKAGEHNDE